MPTPESERQPASNDEPRNAEKVTGQNTQELTDSSEGGEDMDPGEAGEDDGGAPIDGEDGHVRDDQKPTSR